MLDGIIIGCGIVGAAAAHALSRYEAAVLVLEAENDIACGATKANSAILHAGFDPEPGTLMARLNVRGAAMAGALCKSLGVPYRQTGALVLAFCPEEERALAALLERGGQNGVPGLALLDAAQAREKEPALHPAVTAALWAPTAAIVSPWEYALALAETAVRNGVALRRSARVLDIERIPGGYRLHSTAGVFETRAVVNAAGVQADRIHGMAAPADFRIRPSRGEYYLLDKEEGDRVRHIIFQCPTERGKGVLVAPTVHGNLLVGPNAQDVAANDTANTARGLRYVARMARKSVPGVNLAKSIRNFAGVRAAADRDDFIIREVEGAPGFIDLAGIQSPGLTAAPAIAEMAVALLRERGLCLKERTTFIKQPRPVSFRALDSAEKAALIEREPAHGRVVCRCETVTEGEILAALRAPIPPVSVEGVKRRCGAGMGRCQGGFCGPRVVELLATALGVPPTEIPMDREGSWILSGELKGETRHV